MRSERSEQRAEALKLLSDLVLESIHSADASERRELRVLLSQYQAALKQASEAQDMLTEAEAMIRKLAPEPSEPPVVTASRSGRVRCKVERDLGFDGMQGDIIEGMQVLRHVVGLGIDRSRAVIAKGAEFSCFADTMSKVRSDLGQLGYRLVEINEIDIE